MKSDKLPAAVGPYSNGKMIIHGNGSILAYTSGILGLDPKSNQLAGEDVEV